MYLVQRVERKDNNKSLSDRKGVQVTELTPGALLTTEKLGPISVIAEEESTGWSLMPLGSRRTSGWQLDRKLE